LAYGLGIEVSHVTAAMAAALRFDVNDDPEAVELQKSLQELGVHDTITKYTGITQSHPLHGQITGKYEELKQHI
jgi:mannitol-1-phosphate 5-dehydrogenase